MFTNNKRLSSDSSLSMTRCKESSSTGLTTSIRPERVSMAENLLISVYGRVDSSDFPLPMPSGEAGLCSYKNQRRYLWTDAFGVMAYTTLSQWYSNSSEYQNGEINDDEATAMATKYKDAADTLIATVHECLGKPRSTNPKESMTVDKSNLSPTGYIGLRIGKVLSRQVTDDGMTYDGMYWHYIDKWLLALSRTGRHNEEAMRIAKSVFPSFYDSRHGGIHWKLNIDASTLSNKSTAYPNKDTLMALIIFSILQAQQQEQHAQNQPNDREKENSSLLNLDREVNLLKQSLRKGDVYHLGVTSDPLGWGLDAIFDQFIQGRPMSHRLHSIKEYTLQERYLDTLPFRLYGATLGAQALGLSKQTEPLIKKCYQHEQIAIQRDKTPSNEEHSSINRVMLAMCLLEGGVLLRRSSDPVIKLSLIT